MTMSNSFMRSQFLNSTYGRPTLIAGKITLSAPAHAVLVNQGVTYTAVVPGVGGNAITVAYTAGGTAGAEVVTVVGNAISVRIENGVSTVDDLVAAVNGNVSAAALVTASGSGSSTVSVFGPTSLASGTDGVGANNFGLLVSSVTKTGVGQYQVNLDQNYHNEQYVGFRLIAATPVDLIPQLKSVDVASAKTIVVSLLAGATPTDLGASATLVMEAVLNNSSLI